MTGQVWESTSILLRVARTEIVNYTAYRDETMTRIVDPFSIASIDGDWMVIAFDHFREDLRTFNVARILDLHSTGQTFAPPADFQIDAYLDRA